MCRTYGRGTKTRLSFVNMADSMEQVDVSGKKHRKWHVYCAVLYSVSQGFANPWSYLKLFGLPSPLDPETVQLPAFSILSATFTGRQRSWDSLWCYSRAFCRWLKLADWNDWTDFAFIWKILRPVWLLCSIATEDVKKISMIEIILFLKKRFMVHYIFFKL